MILIQIAVEAKIVIQEKRVINQMMGILLQNRSHTDRNVPDKVQVYKNRPKIPQNPKVAKMSSYSSTTFRRVQEGPTTEESNYKADQEYTSGKDNYEDTTSTFGQKPVINLEDIGKPNETKRRNRGC